MSLRIGGASGSRARPRQRSNSHFRGEVAAITRSPVTVARVNKEAHNMNLEDISELDIERLKKAFGRRAESGHGGEVPRRAKETAE